MKTGNIVESKDRSQATDAVQPIPLGVQKFMNVFSVYISGTSISKGLRFVPSSTDVIISTASKCGTTWVQQICHGLRSGGDMSFEEISTVIPCLEMAHDSGYTDLQMNQPYLPRMYKTHFPYAQCPKGAGKYIVVVRFIQHPVNDCLVFSRQPADAVVSMYHFLKDWVYTAEDMSADTFVEFFCLNREPKHHLEGSSQIHHMLSWHPHRFDENVLWLHYEDLIENLRECVRLIAEFLNIGKDNDKLQELVTHQASFEFMKAHVEKYDEHILKRARNEIAGLPRDAGILGNSGKVRQGKINGAKMELTDRSIACIDELWKDLVTTHMGHPTYDAFREHVNAELDRRLRKIQ